jgi:uncharacterized iron-regulated membrane protein
VIGIWCAPVLLVMILTGLVMSYQWAIRPDPPLFSLVAAH